MHVLPCHYILIITSAELTMTFMLQLYTNQAEIRCQACNGILTLASIAGSASITAVKHLSALVLTATAVSHNTFSICKQQITLFSQNKLTG